MYRDRSKATVRTSLSLAHKTTSKLPLADCRPPTAKVDASYPSKPLHRLVSSLYFGVKLGADLRLQKRQDSTMSSQFPYIGHGTGTGNASGNNNRATMSFLNWRPEHHEIRKQESGGLGVALAVGGGLAIGAVALWASLKNNGESVQRTSTQNLSIEEESILSVDLKLESIRRRQARRNGGTEPASQV
jgi:hypothetical protein